MNKAPSFLYLIYTISFIDLFAIGLTFPLFSNHLRQLGASHFTVGLISSLYSGTQVISGPIIGSWSDIRDRKFVATTTLSVCSLCYIFLGLTNSLVLIVLLRFILGILKHTQSLCKAILTDLLPASEQAGAFGKEAAFGSIGFIAGPVLGGHLAEYENGFSYVCLLTGVLFIINIALTLFLPKTTRANQDQEKKQTKFFITIKNEVCKSFIEMKNINWSSLWDTFLLRFIFGLTVTTYFSQQSVYLQEEFNLSQRHIGYTISYFSGVGTISALLLQNLKKYFYKNDENCLRRLTHFFLLMTGSCVCLYLSTHIWTFLLFLVPFSVSCTVLRIVSMELVFKKSENLHTGSLSGISNSVMSVARFVTPTITGLIADKSSEHSVLFLLSFLPLIGTVLCFSMRFKISNTKLKMK